jgi:hypothetical protein
MLLQRSWRLCPWPGASFIHPLDASIIHDHSEIPVYVPGGDRQPVLFQYAHAGSLRQCVDLSWLTLPKIEWNDAGVSVGQAIR